MTLLVSVPEELHAGFGPGGRPVQGVKALRELLAHDSVPTTVVLGPGVPLQQATDLAAELRLSRPEVGFVLLHPEVTAEVLGEALRAGVREVVALGQVQALHDAVRRSDELGRAMQERTRSQEQSQPRRGRLVTVFSAKGGCGKTTMATNIAAVLADGGRREVVIVDLDLAFGDVAIALQLFPSRTIADAVPMGSGNLDLEGVQLLLTPHSPGLTALVAPLEPGAAGSIPASLVTSILELLRQRYDYVVVDTPPAFDDQVLAAFDLSDVIVLLATLDIPALKNLKLTLETLEVLHYARESWSIVLNRADSKVGLALAEVEKTLRTSVTAQVPSSRDVPASVNRGVPIVLDQPGHPVSLAIRAFAEQHVATPADAGADKVPASLRTDRRGWGWRRGRG